jgi:beta-glucosidase/6-phospho-beta-glucosidase/beta-galactosidase
MPKEPPPFPADFTWGAAVAGFQVDMGCPTLPPERCEDRASDWYAFITGERFLSQSYMVGDAPSKGPGFWELYPEDLRRAKEEIGLEGFRMSVEWSRVFPTATDGIEGYEALKAAANPEALATYHAIFAELKARGIKPFVTLHHYTLPTWIHDAVGCNADLSACTERGWLDKERTVREISKFAAFAAREFGGEVDEWATLNEPLALSLPGYVQPGKDRANPPAVSLQFEAFKAVTLAMIEGHARMYDAVKAADTADADGDGSSSRVGLVYNLAPVRGRTDSRVDQRAAENVFYLYNTVFLDATIKGSLDANLDRNPVQRDDLAGRMDFLGINYYTRSTVDGTGDAQLPTLSPLTTFNPFTVTVWEDYPRGIYEMIMHVKARYGVPMVISENGTEKMADGDKGTSFVVRNLQWVRQARKEGADVRGYYVWTLMDNYEWNHGMSLKFGLYAVDTENAAKPRTLRDVGRAYGRVISANDIPADLAEKYPADGLP